MEMNETEGENSLARHVVENENSIYFQIGAEPVNDIGPSHNQMLRDGDYQTLSRVPAVVISETKDVHVVQEETPTNNNYRTTLEEKDTNTSANSIDEATLDVDSYDKKIVNINTIKNNDNDIVWDGLLSRFGCDKCPYGAKTKYLLLRHLKTHSKDRFHENKNLNIDPINDEAVDYEKDHGFDDENPAISMPKKRNNPDNDVDILQQSTFSCNECSFTTHQKYRLSRHVKTHSGDRPHKCTVCARGFTTGTSLMAHINVHYGIKNHVCKYCQKTFTTSGELTRHIKYKHTQEKRHKCTECDYAAVESSKLKRHMRCHTGERPYQCNQCSYASQDNCKLSRHERSHTGEKPFKCDTCNACYTQSNSLKFHKLTHDPTEKLLYSCDLCLVTKSRKWELRRHIKEMHLSNKLKKRKQCGETFSDIHLYSLHNETHEREKYFKCQLCPFAAKKFIQLEIHMMIHTGEKPVGCAHCDQSFIDKRYLRRHQYRYHNKIYQLKEKRYECPICKRPFAYEGNLIRHKASCVSTQGSSIQGSP